MANNMSFVRKVSNSKQSWQIAFCFETSSKEKCKILCLSRRNQRQKRNGGNSTLKAVLRKDLGVTVDQRQTISR